METVTLLSFGGGNLNHDESQEGRGVAELGKTDITVRLGDDVRELLQRLDRFAEAWLAGRVVPEGDVEAAGRVAEDARDGGERGAPPHHLGSERVAERVGVEPGLGEPDAPPAEDPADVVRRHIREETLFEGSAAQPLAALDRLVAERDDAWAAFASDTKYLRAQVDVLTAEARELRAAKASAEQKLQEIGIAVVAARGKSWPSFRDSYLLHEIDRFLPTEYRWPVLRDGGQDQPAQRDITLPAGPDRAPEHPAEEP